MELRLTALARPSGNFTDNLETRPLVREDAPQEENRNSLKMFCMEVEVKLVAVPDRGLVTGQPDRRTVGSRITLNLN
jgi:hypothetical protein